MVRQIRGVVAYTEEAAVIIDVHGVGYLVHVSIPPTQFPIGAEMQLFTHLAVRENALDLYGFIDRDTLEIFELLLTLPKIGPKSALQILSQADITLLKHAVRNEDASYLSKMSGIGKKSAEKIVVGLKEKFEDWDINTAQFSEADDSETETSYARDTIDALIALGYPADDARRAVRQIANEHTDVQTSPDALKIALKRLSN